MSRNRHHQIAKVKGVTDMSSQTTYILTPHHALRHQQRQRFQDVPLPVLARIVLVRSPAGVDLSSSDPCLADKRDKSPCHRCRSFPSLSRKG